MISVLIYFAGFLFWFGIWKYANGYQLMRSHKELLIPFIMCAIFIFLNMLFSYFFNFLGEASYEESRFNFIDSRIQNLLSATSSIIVVATVVYGITIKKLPVEFVRFMTLSFIFQLSFSTPILWIPERNNSWFVILRNLQTVGLIYGVFLCVSGIVLILKAIPTTGELILNRVLDREASERTEEINIDKF